MNILERIIAFIFTKLFSSGLGKITSQYPSQEFFVVSKKDNLDTLINQAKSFGEKNKWSFFKLYPREGSRIITWVEGGFGTSYPRTVGFEVREAADKYYIWAESRYNRNQMTDRGENRKNIDTLKTYFNQQYGIVPSDLSWAEAVKQIPLK